MTKVTEEQVLEIRRLHKKGTSIARLKDKYKLSRSGIQLIIKRRTWKDLEEK